MARGVRLASMADRILRARAAVNEAIALHGSGSVTAHNARHDLEALILEGKALLDPHHSANTRPAIPAVTAGVTHLYK